MLPVVIKPETMKYLLLAATLVGCVSSAPKNAPQRALKVVWNHYRGHSAKALAVDAKHVYVLGSDDDYVSVRRFPRGGGAAEDVIDPSSDGGDATAIAVDDTHVFWLMSVTSDETHQTRLMRAPKQVETRAETIATVDGKPGDLVLVGNEVIFSTVEEEPAIYRSHKAGGSQSAVAHMPEKSKPVDLLPHDGKLLVADYEHDVVQEVTVQGEIRDVMKLANPVELAVHNGRLSAVALSGVYDVPSGKQRARGSDSAIFDAIAEAPEGLYYGHRDQLRFLPWNSDQAVILQKAQFGVDDIVVADEGLYYINNHVVWYRARVKSG